jgi:hypothetical protein
MYPSKILILMTGLFLATSALADTPVGSRYFALGAPTSNSSTTTVFTAAANVSGATIRTLSAADGVGTQTFLLGNYPDGTSRVIYSLIGMTGTVVNGTLPYPVDLAAGVGLSVLVSQGVAAQLYMTYDFR